LVGQAGDDEPGDQQEGPQPVQETPAELPDAEPLDEERIVPYTDESQSQLMEQFSAMTIL